MQLSCGDAPLVMSDSPLGQTVICDRKYFTLNVFFYFLYKLTQHVWCCQVVIIRNCILRRQDMLEFETLDMP